MYLDPNNHKLGGRIMKKDFSKYKDTLTMKEVQEILGVDSQSVLRLCEEKRIYRTLYKGSYIYSKRTVLGYLNDKENYHYPDFGCEQTDAKITELYPFSDLIEAAKKWASKL